MSDKQLAKSNIFESAQSVTMKSIYNEGYKTPAEIDASQKFELKVFSLTKKLLKFFKFHNLFQQGIARRLEPCPEVFLFKINFIIMSREDCPTYQTKHKISLS